MKVIGLTGGIGSGKSTVSEYLQGKGAFIIDADKLAREIVEPGKPVLSELVQVFGKEILNSDGSLDRKKLGAIVFSDSDKLKILNKITHKEIYRLTLETLEMLRKEGKAKLVVLDAPLLFEAGMDVHTLETWAIGGDEELRIKLMIERDRITEEEVRARLNNQVSDSERNRRATHQITNDGSTEELFSQVDVLLEGLKFY